MSEHLSTDLVSRLSEPSEYERPVSTERLIQLIKEGDKRVRQQEGEMPHFWKDELTCLRELLRQRTRYELIGPIKGGSDV